jgi:hypothetical protein
MVDVIELREYKLMFIQAHSESVEGEGMGFEASNEIRRILEEKGGAVALDGFLIVSELLQTDSKVKSVVGVRSQKGLHQVCLLD